LTHKKSFDGLLKKINGQLLQHGVILKHGAGIMDASITESSFCPKGTPTYEVVEDRKEYGRSEEETHKETQTINVIKREIFINF
jgi:hypothetical protein